MTFLQHNARNTCGTAWYGLAPQEMPCGTGLRHWRHSLRHDFSRRFRSIATFATLCDRQSDITESLVPQRFPHLRHSATATRQISCPEKRQSRHTPTGVHCRVGPTCRGGIRSPVRNPLFKFNPRTVRAARIVRGFGLHVSVASRQRRMSPHTEGDKR